MGFPMIGRAARLAPQDIGAVIDRLEVIGIDARADPTHMINLSGGGNRPMAPLERHAVHVGVKVLAAARDDAIAGAVLGAEPEPTA